jgi:CheY-like chemotaxis protein
MPHATILYTEDDARLRRTVTKLLEAEGWSVDAFADGNSALNRIAGGFAYALLLFDDELPGVCGLELARYARTLPTYSRTPIILLAAGEHAEEARRAGADVCLQKPEGVSRLIEVIQRLLPGV